CIMNVSIFFFQAEDGIRDRNVTGVQTCALPISRFNDDIHEVSLPEGRGFGLDSERLACAPSTVNLARMAEEINPINDATTTTTIKYVVPWIAIHTVSPHDRTITNTSRAIARSSSAGPAIIR